MQSQNIQSKTNENQSALLNLPLEVLVSVMDYLSPLDLLMVAQVCRQLSSPDVEDLFWNKKLTPSEKTKRLESGLFAKQIWLPKKPLCAFIKKNKGQFSEEDMRFVDAIIEKEKFHYRSLRSETYFREHGEEREITHYIETADEKGELYKIPTIEGKTAEDYKRTTFFDYLGKNRFILCRKFVEIPIVKDYLLKLTKSDLTYHASYLYKFDMSDEKGNRISPTINLETILLSCLLTESINPKHVSPFVWNHLNFVKMPLIQKRISTVTNIQELYELSRQFVQYCHNFDKEIDKEVLGKFYDCYIDYVVRQNNNGKNDKLVEELINEMVDYCDVKRPLSSKENLALSNNSCQIL